jgi:hypothetical protein
MNDGEKTIAVCSAIGAAGLLVLAGETVRVRRQEKKKREAIKAWEQEVVRVIHTSRDDVMRDLADPNKKLSETMQKYHVDQRFIDILMNNRPF